MAENGEPVNHEDVSILIDRPPPMPVADHFLDGAQGSLCATIASQ